MNYQMIDLLDKTIAKDQKNDRVTLCKEGVISPQGQADGNKLNLMAGALAGELLDNLADVGMKVQDVIEHIETLYKRNEFMGIYYFLLALIEALGMEVPYLFMQLSGSPDVLQRYIYEFMADMRDYSMDLE